MFLSNSSNDVSILLTIAIILIGALIIIVGIIVWIVRRRKIKNIK